MNALRREGKHWLKRSLLRCRILPAIAMLRKTGVAILRYHSIQEDPVRNADAIDPDIVHRWRTFADQMELVAQKFTPVTIDDVLSYVDGEKPIPRRAVAITFDDGYADNYEIALPVLRRLGLRAAFYVAVDSIGNGHLPWFCRLRYAFAKTKSDSWRDPETGTRFVLKRPGIQSFGFEVAFARCATRNGKEQERFLQDIEKDLAIEYPRQNKSLMMTWHQVRTLHQEGHIVGSHSLSHPNLAHVSEGATYLELSESKERLERELGAPVVHFSYPNPALVPNFSAATIAASRRTGYRTGVTSVDGPVYAGDDVLSLRRIWVPHDNDEFLWVLECTLLGRRV